MKRIVLTLFLFLAFQLGFAQSEKIPVYPQDYFKPPLKIPLLLAGNFGECRPGHFHSGIDIKTNGKENLPVYAAADGYVSRIKIEKGGYGHAIYITHPGGFTTLYAHLNNFTPKLQKYLRSMQYAKESWAIDVSLTPDQFPVKQEEQIAWSGNTGSSTAPHLHFEIRDSKTEHPLNPQLFGFEIKDNIAPVLLKIAVYCDGWNESEQDPPSFYDSKPEIFSIKKKNGIYTTVDEVIQIPKTENKNRLRLGFELNDYMNESTNTLTFYLAEWYVDEIPKGNIRLHDIGYDVTRYINAYTDYRLKFSDGIWIQNFFRLPGNKLGSIFENLTELIIEDEEIHDVKMVFNDAAGNKSALIFKFRLISKPKGKSTGSRNDCHFFKAGLMNKTEGDHFAVSLPADALYDDVCFVTGETTDAKALSPHCKIHSPEIPVHTRFDLLIRPDKPIPFSQRSKIVMMYSDGKEETGEAASAAEKGWYQIRTRSFGTYWLVADTVAPVITSLLKNNAVPTKVDRLTFSVKEKTTSVKIFRAELDGKWIRFEPRGDTFFYEIDEHCPKGKHTLVLTATDENDNTSRLKFSFTR